MNRKEKKEYMKKWEEEHRKERVKYRKLWRIKNKGTIHKYNKDYHDYLKQLVISHYGGRCAICGETHLSFLCIDHINNDGFKCKENARFGTGLYCSIIREGFPSGYQVLCWNHNWLKHLDFMKPNLSNNKRAIKDRKYAQKVKEKVLDHYGHVCVCCGETDIRVLGMDHIHGGGKKHREEINCLRSISFNRYLIEHNFPDDVQVMCMNCNCGRQVNGGVCPHVGRGK